MAVLELLFYFLGVVQASVGDVPYPPNAVVGGTVVALVTLDSGAVSRVEIASGEEPFASAVRSSLAQWRFPDEPENRTVTVVVNYRGPTLQAVGDPQRDVAPPSSAIRFVPYPKAVMEAPYPPNAVGGGSVVLKVKIAPSGAVEKTEALKSLGSFTDAARDAVRAWRFDPAHDQNGRAVASHAYAVFVFRSPVLTSPPRR